MNNKKQEFIVPEAKPAVRSKKRPYIISIAVVVIAASASYGYYSGVIRARARNASQQTSDATSGNNSVRPKNFPADVPIEPGAVIIRKGYTVTNSTSDSAIEFISSKSLDENMSFYESALPRTGWKLTQHATSTDPVGQKQSIIVATRDNNQLVVRIFLDPRNQTEVHVAINNQATP